MDKSYHHPMISDNIINGNFKDDQYTVIQPLEGSTEEYLLFIIHGIGQSVKSLKSKIEKIKRTIQLLYEKKSYLLRKKLHVRIVNWKYLIQKNSDENFAKLIDINNVTKYPKIFINQIPQDLIYFLIETNRFEIINDIILQMNIYYDLVKKYRPLFRGGVSVIGHSLGGVIIYDICKEMSYVKENEQENDKSIITEKKEEIIMTDPIKSKLNRNKRKKNLEIIPIKKEVDDLISNSSNIILEVNNDTYHTYTKGIAHNNIIIDKKVISKNPKIPYPLKFGIDHVFFLGSPLSLFISIEDKTNPIMKEMETVKDFHNIIHPMDPVAYRIEPLIQGYQEIQRSFMLPHWENDGVRNLVDVLIDQFNIFESRNKYENYDSKFHCKRYDFMVQENLIEKALHIVGFLFSHTAYWNNPDVFYFVIKMIHWQGYNEVNYNNFFKRVENNYKTEAL